MYSMEINQQRDDVLDEAVDESSSKTYLLEVIAGLRKRFAEQEILVQQREKEIEERTRALLDALYDAKKYLLILEQADLIVILLDGASHRFVYLNKQAEDIFGYKRDDVLRSSTTDILQLVPLVRGSELFNGEFQTTLNEGGVFHGDFAFIKKNEEQGAVRLTVSRFAEEGGAVLLVILGEDITTERERTREERQRVEETERLNQLMIGRELRMIALKEEIRRLRM